MIINRMHCFNNYRHDALVRKLLAFQNSKIDIIAFEQIVALGVLGHHPYALCNVQIAMETHFIHTLQWRHI